MLESDRLSRFDPFPLTDVQRAYWLGRRNYFELGNIACHGYFEFVLPELDGAALRAAWRG